MLLLQIGIELEPEDWVSTVVWIRPVVEIDVRVVGFICMQAILAPDVRMGSMRPPAGEGVDQAADVERENIRSKAEEEPATVVGVRGCPLLTDGRVLLDLIPEFVARTVETDVLWCLMGWQ